ncbi:hypothetical protein PMAYCL1PPCAC_25847 [Pristionchus mayeri]|uniref:Uncharacterized protein n=1 Tax=Pristionchus mayeri TaxID=1317129 RepID=A0AAN5D3Z0_9BILA|nr:hypothetical protein PMAYCL1PPCAC_25847 [Pristionchus mayeri]
MNGRHRRNASFSWSNSILSSFPSMSRQDSVVSMTPSVISIEVQTDEKGHEMAERDVETISSHRKGDDQLSVIAEDDERKISVISQYSIYPQAAVRQESNMHSTIEEVNVEKETFEVIDGIQ